ncbi:Bcr/CflA family drug resistance efflux transporter [Aliidongia dinghuensis]|uniref:Bcr/CflA family efflux transporter n=1 Tax=Aliidongia dinghuensis TaxID=1867774 RepID=A0A8J3E636_9PROT|nr:multidrug effflux MFS transporter [Aliidongia dinghuensis]GGF40865.1 Bcr/CflA family drug resistance efflux transporter [Aliidongia dinghuensis]
MTVASTSAATPHAGMGFREFVALIAAIMAVNALAVDTMLPALPDIGQSLAIPTENARQWVVTAYLLGFGAAQIVYGPLADHFGRKPILLGGLAAYTIFSLAAGLSVSFEMMLIARVLQGIAAASSRVLVISIVRDCYGGRKMARVMSLAFIVFLAVPILAPSIGQLIMLAFPWRSIFIGLTLFGIAVLAWAALRLPETLHEEDRQPTSIASVVHAFRLTVSNRVAVGYMCGQTLMYGGLVGFINSAQQVFVDVFQAGRLFTTIFALIAVFMAISSVLNARFVGRYGTRVISHSALIGYIVVAGGHATLAIAGHETLVTFALCQSAMMFCFGLVGPNFGAMAMEPLGHVAGTASSVQGFVSTVVGALIGFYVGQHFNGTVTPLTLGFTGCSSLALIAVLWAERGRLFQPTASGIASAADMAH